MLLFIGCSLWTGQRAWLLGLERQRLDAGHIGEGSWCGEFLQGTRQPGADRSAWLQVLGEQAHGPHEMAWWLNGIQLKLGLLGKVIGFLHPRPCSWARWTASTPARARSCSRA